MSRALTSGGARLARLIVVASAAIAALTCLPFASPAAAAGLRAGAVTLSVLSVSPTTPVPSYTKSPLTITVRVRNNTSEPLTGVTINGIRLPRINDQTSLDAAMAHPAQPDPSLESPITTDSVSVDVSAGDTSTAIFTTTADISNGVAGICLCETGIYPLYFTASVQSGGHPVLLGTTQTFIPSFSRTTVAKLQVGWVWPLLDVPHRLTSSNVFLDDNLAGEIAPGGRLDRALAVLEAVAQTVPLTVVTDPELLDELQVMAHGGYQVTHPGAANTAGTGSGDAAAWLARLRAVFAAQPKIELMLTNYGDPDVDALQRHGLTWTAALPPDVQARMPTALGGITPVGSIDWPLNDTLSKSTLGALVKEGTQTVILGGATLPHVIDPSSAQNALASLTTDSGQVSAGITNPSIEAWAGKVFVPHGEGASYLPQLVSQVALNAVNMPDQSHFLLITPPRQLDVDPTVASQAILDTATTAWATPIPLGKAVATLPAKSTGEVKTQPSPQLPTATVGSLQYVASSLPGLSSLFFDADRTVQIGSLPTASQLAASSSAVLAGTTVDYSNQLREIVSSIRDGVHLVSPAQGRYTLTSTNSSLPITITNGQPVSVQVDVAASAVGGVPGFAATPLKVRTIAARSTVQVRLPTHFDRTGRIQVQVRLSTPSGLTLGSPITLDVRSTALGTVGVVITAVAGVVLVIALLVRAIRRLRARSRQQPKAVA